jgi:hypothetical protein
MHTIWVEFVNGSGLNNDIFLFIASGGRRWRRCANGPSAAGSQSSASSTSFPRIICSQRSERKRKLGAVFNARAARLALLETGQEEEGFDRGQPSRNQATHG